MRWLFPLVTALAALWGTPAGAADVAQLACPIDGLDAAQKAAVGEAALRRAPPGPWRDALFGAIGECVARFGWTDDQARNVAIHTLSMLAAPAMRDLLGGRSIDFAALSEIVEGDTVFQDAFATTNNENVPLNAFLDRHRAGIERAAGPALVDAVARPTLRDYLSALAMGAWARRQFAAS